MSDKYDSNAWMMGGSPRTTEATRVIRGGGGHTADVGALGVTLLLWASAYAGIRAGLHAYTPGHLALVRFLVARPPSRSMAA